MEEKQMWETLSSYDTKLFSHAYPTKKERNTKNTNIN